MPNKKEQTTKLGNIEKQLTIPVTKSGVIDKRYVDPQIVKKNGTRDMRCKLSSEKN